MARFIYHGPVQSIALAIGRAKDKNGNEVSRFKDVDLVPGKETPDLPETNPIVAAMIARQLLRPVAAPAKSSGTSAKPAAASQGEK